MTDWNQLEKYQMQDEQSRNEAQLKSATQHVQELSIKVSVFDAVLQAIPESVRQVRSLVEQLDAECTACDGIESVIAADDPLARSIDEQNQQIRTQIEVLEGSQICHALKCLIDISKGTPSLCRSELARYRIL